MTAKTHNKNHTAQTTPTLYTIEISDELAAKLDEIDPNPNRALRILLDLDADASACAG